MCFLVAKKFNDDGCITIKMEHGQHLADFKKGLMEKVGHDEIQLITISRPSAYGEYEPYRFIESEAEFERAVLAL